MVGTLTKRQQMVKGSIWTATKDFKVLSHAKSKMDLGYEQKDPTDPKSPYQHTFTVTDAVYIDIPKGATLEVFDKQALINPTSYATGLFIPILFKDQKGYAWIEYKEMADHVELTKAGTITPIFVLHSESQGYLGKLEWEYDDVTHDWSTKVQWHPKLPQALKKKRMQDVKQFLLGHSGYYQGIDTSSVPDWFDPSRNIKIDFPDDLQIQQLDKATKEIVDTVSAKEYLEGAFRLRPWTIKYGSAARALFKDIEDTVDEFETLVMFKDAEGPDYYGETSKKITELKEEFKAAKFKRGTYAMKSSIDAVAFAFKTRSDAIMFRLSYSGDLPSQVLDPKTLEETV